MSSPIVLILGAGARVGASVAAKFASKNYKVAVAARKGTDSQTLEGYLSLKADFTEPSTIPALFEKVKSELGVPNVVVYNAAALTQPPDESSVLSIPSESVLADFNVNTLSAYVAAQEAVKGWSTLTENSKTLFIYTGNGLNTIVAPVPVFMNLGMGKSASAHFIGLADLTCKTKGYRFIFADERKADGGLMGMAISGPAHAEFFTQLADDGAKDMPWHATFVKDKGYVKF